MNVGQAITQGMRAQRRKDIAALERWCGRHWKGYGMAGIHRLRAYWWWGWEINGRGGLGKPGSEL